MKNYLYYREGMSYPLDKYFRPACAYPEYPFLDAGLSETPNDVYDSIRDMFICMGLDKENTGNSKWNPLSEYIKKDDVVLIKPNWVKHENSAVNGIKELECLITHSSIIKCLIDYTLIALHGTGEIIVADAPVQSCDFDKLQQKSGINMLREFYQNENVKVEFVDLRNYKSRREGTHIISLPLSPKYGGTIVNIGKHSYFYQNSKEGRLRITNYDSRIVNQHHKGKIQKYCISDACLKADVIINLPKPKTHRKAGYTGALKNMVGINAKKEYLPHHTKGSYVSGSGDEYYSESRISRIKSDVNDIVNIFESKSMFTGSSIVRKIGDFLVLGKTDSEKYSEGSWWGNNTIWKTILDLNLVVLYIDKTGILRKDQQRKVITLGDLVIAGEGEGPLMPTPKKANSLLFADNSVLFDLILVRLMGFSDEKFMLLKKAIKNRKLFDGNADMYINSNRADWEKKLSKFLSGYVFKPARGWKDYLR